MSTWNDPKTDWQGGETPTNADVNRWEENAQYLNDHKLSNADRSVQLKHLPTSTASNCVLRVEAAGTDPYYGKVDTNYIANGAVNTSKLASDVKSQFSSFSSGEATVELVVHTVAGSVVECSFDIRYQRYGQIVTSYLYLNDIPQNLEGASIEYIEGSKLPFAAVIANDPTMYLHGSGVVNKLENWVMTGMPLIAQFLTSNKHIEPWLTTGERYTFESGHILQISLTYMITNQNAEAYPED